jgi:hypothetical protein
VYQLGYVLGGYVVKVGWTGGDDQDIVGTVAKAHDLWMLAF